MLGIYLLVAICTAFIAGIIFRYYTKNNSYAAILTGIVTLLAVFLIHLIMAPNYYVNQFPTIVREQHPFFNLIAVQSPNEYNIYIAKVQKNIRDKDDPNREIYYSMELINSLLLKYGPQASDESLFQYLQADVEFDKQLYQIGPALVLFHQFPEQFENKIDIDKLSIISRNQLDSEIFNYAEAVITSGIQKSHAPPSKADIARARSIFAGILANLAQKYGSPNIIIMTLKNPDNVTLDKVMTANILLDFSEAILAQGQATVGLLLRSSYAETNGSMGNMPTLK